jgi:hypothetical protein
MTVVTAREWYLPILVAVPPIAFLAALGFTLWSGKLYVRGPIYTRAEAPSVYWTGTGFIAICAAVTIYIWVSVFG